MAPNRLSPDPIVIIGAGAAGLSTALALSPQPVILITKTESLLSGSTPWAQGGIAAALSSADSAESHAQDTLAAGADLCDPSVAKDVCAEAPRTIARLLTLGMPLDRDATGRIDLAREAAHSRHRVAHAGGDSTGKALAETLAERVLATPSIQVLTNTVAVDLATQPMDGGPRVRGVLVYGPYGWRMIASDAVILASGGMGMAWDQTTNPAENTGDGLAMAARAQALMADLEFMQFHPTALDVPSSDGSRLPLLTEALRGAGAHLLDQDGQRFMLAEHPLAELAPRDVVARAIGQRRARGEKVFLDLRPALAKEGAGHFPQVLKLCQDHGFDPWNAPVPITPAAHYHMGGVVTDQRGRTSLPGLWACGEVACTGLHGANRLASNSLLEALVFADRVASDIVLALADGRHPATPGPRAHSLPPVASLTDCRAIQAEIRRVMGRHVGLLRDAEGLYQAETALAGLVDLFERLPPNDSGKNRLDTQTVRQWVETRALLTIAPLIVQSAQRRQESRGAHARNDHPTRQDALRRRLTLRLGEGLRDASLCPPPAPSDSPETPATLLAFRSQP